MKKYFGLTILLLIIGVLGFSRPQAVAASTTTETVAYQVNKAGTTTASLANSFFDHEATVTLQNGQPIRVTLHLTKFASYVKSFAIGTQAAKITNESTNTADLTFVVDDQFKQATVAATMSVMNMNQKADIVFAKALVQPITQTVKFQVNKAGTTTPSLANSFFDHEATVTLINNRPASVTLHLTKFASYVKSFVIGTQGAQITNATANTADLTFNIDDQFKASKVTATMSVMNMTQQADLVFEKALWSTPADQQPTTTTPQTTATPTVVKPTVTQPTKTTATQQAKDSVTARLYQARNGQLTDTASAAQQFMSPTATVVRGNTHTTITLHTTGAEYIKAMRVAGQLGHIINRHGDDADLVFTLANAELHYALPVTFSLSVPGAAQMTQQAFLLIDLAPQTAKVDPKAPQLTTTKTSNQVSRLATAGIAAHAIDANKTQQDIAYSVLDASGNATSTADQYFTHTAHVVKDATGYLVDLTVRVTAGVVQFTPQSVNGGAISDLTHTTTNGQDVWTFAFHVSDAAALDQLVPATIVMSVPMANIFNQQFEIQLAFAKNAGAMATAAGGTTTNQSAKAPITIKKVAATTKAGDQAATNTTKSVQSDQALPHLKKYPIGWELLGFVVIDLLIVLAAGLLRRRHMMEVAHD